MRKYHKKAKMRIQTNEVLLLSSDKLYKVDKKVDNYPLSSIPIILNFEKIIFIKLTSSAQFS